MAAVDEVGSVSVASQKLAQLAEEYFTTYLVTDPMFATTLGVPGHADRIQDPSRAAGDRRADELLAFEARGKAIDPSGLDRADRVTLAILLQRLRSERDSAVARTSEVSVSASVAGDLSDMLSSVPLANLSDEERAESYVRRLTALKGYFDALGQRYLQAKAEGRYPVATSVRAAIEQLDGYLGGELASDPLLDPVISAPDLGGRWRTRAEEAVLGEVRPALSRLRSVWADELLPVARDDDHVGLCHTPGGEDGYEARVRLWTSVTVTGQEVHQLGLRVVAEAREEISRVSGSLFGTNDASEVVRRLRDGQGEHFESAEQIVSYIGEAYRRAVQGLPGWFKDFALPDCEVREMDPHQARGGTAAYYTRRPQDGSRPARLWVNTHEPRKLKVASFESLAFHEGVPGHHLQFSVVAGTTGLPEFRRHFDSYAHNEGWGLYVEGLADEMGLYSSPAARLGMLMRALLRAARLVVDTGIHCMGWPRSRAVDYLQENSDLPVHSIENEVERYIAAPGQALTYMVGRIRIEQLRDRARHALGSAFDIAEFHDRVLADGSMPLDVLDDSISEWIKEH